jgi:hypothetical protein
VSHADSSPRGPAVNQNVVGMQITHDNILKEYCRNFKKNLERNNYLWTRKWGQSKKSQKKPFKSVKIA